VGVGGAEHGRAIEHGNITSSGCHLARTSARVRPTALCCRSRSGACSGVMSRIGCREWRPNGSDEAVQDWTERALRERRPTMDVHGRRHRLITSARCPGLPGTAGSSVAFAGEPQTPQDQPSRVATRAGHVSDGPAARRHWVMELP